MRCQLNFIDLTIDFTGIMIFLKHPKIQLFYNESYCYISLFFLIKNSNIIPGNNILKFNTFLQIFID